MPHHTTQPRRSSIVPMLFVRIILCVVIASAAEYAFVLLENRLPEWTRTASIASSAAFALFALVYLYWAVRFSSSDGYRSSGLRRLGLVFSALGALLVSAKLGFPDSTPGPTYAYFLSALILAYVIRPLLERAGLKTQKQASIGL